MTWFLQNTKSTMNRLIIDNAQEWCVCVLYNGLWYNTLPLLEQ